MTLIYVLLALLLLGILITIHEGGHFFAARLMKIDVAEFSIGMGPKILGWNSKKYDTKFSLRAIPLGGYCAFVGDETDRERTEAPNAFGNQNVWKRMFVILMGPVMNLVLAFVVAWMFFAVNGVTVATGIDPYIIQVTGAGAAYKAGMRDGSQITEVNGVNVLDGTLETLMDTLSAWKEGDAPLKVTWTHEGKTYTEELTPVWDPEEDRPLIGVTIGGIYRTEERSVNVIEACEQSFKMCVQASGAILRALKDLVTTGQGLDQTSGPVGIINLVSQETRSGGLKAYLQLLVLISINLGLMNLLPIPGLDGSRLVFGLIEVVRGKPVPPQKEAMVHLVGMMLLFALMIFFTFRDVMNLFH